MAIEIRQETADALPVYATIPMTFWVHSLMRVDSEGSIIRLSEQPVDPPYLKDYDAIGESPHNWAQLWDLSNWGFFLARENGEPVAGAAVAWQTPGFELLEGRNDLAVLWDLRVKTEHRRRGLGRTLFRHAIQWARERQCQVIKIETQNNNVPACRFYEVSGCRLGEAHPGAYAELPDEVMLLWYLDLKDSNIGR